MHLSTKGSQPSHGTNRTLLQHEKSYAHYRMSTGSYAHYRHPTGSKQNCIAVCAPTKCPRATDNNTNRFNALRLLTRACAWHNVHTPAHQVSKNRPRNKSSQTTIFFYIRVELHTHDVITALSKVRFSVRLLVHIDG